MKLPPKQVLSTPDAVRSFLERIYPKGTPAPGWESVGVDTEHFYEENAANVVGGKGPCELAYIQLSQGTERIVIDGPLVSRARGKPYSEYDLPKLLASWLKDPKVKKRISTTRADYRALRDSGYVKMRGVEMDTEVMDWLFDENRMFHGLKDCAQDHCGIPMDDYSKLFFYHPMKKDGTPAKKKLIANMKMVVEGKDKGHPVPWTGEEGRAKAEEYASKDPYATFHTAEFHRRELKKVGLWEWYKQVERPLTMTLMRMEDRGIRLHVPAVNHIRKQVYSEVLRMEHIVRATVSDVLATPAWDLNLRSPLQMQKLLFQKKPQGLGWPVLEQTEAQAEAEAEDGEERGSLAAAVLTEYEKKGYKLATYIKNHRNKGTMHNVFLVGALDKRDSETDLIHTIFKQARTVTGRLSSGDRKLKKMNLQNIPVQKSKDPYRLRQFFLPTLDTYDLIVADYAQIELYILAQVSRDKRMVQAFQRGEDLHMLTAAKIFGLKLPKEPKDWNPNSSAYKAWQQACEEWKEKYKEERGKAKPVNFGLNYGMSAYKLANDFDLDKHEAEKWVEAYFSLYPGVLKYMERTMAFCRRNGYVTTVSGRRRRIPEIDSMDKAIRGHAERQCINAPIQGSAADIIKVAMNALEYGTAYKCDEKYIGREALKASQRAKDCGYRQLLQVHDELVGQAPKKYAKECSLAVTTVMESVFPQVFVDVKIKASVGCGPNWHSAKK